ncbi:SAC3/GANP family protein [Nitzschia inconspicua]|uniref:SAC3/GANP family protein n=1 Tax=Nitzschia inconspicua TaxID=303405 RepID=A0A9K3M592_9STRA|nr:SAC3/GANP family protein [Nitzschia inconspicua]
MTASSSYRFCSREEVKERQELGQVSELEATVATCRLAQAQRILDPTLAVAKYRRSAAGMDPVAPPRSVATLMDTLEHLTNICSTFQASPQHPRLDNNSANIHTLVNFVTDRLRACQSDATRLMGCPDDESLPASWHAQAIRILIWLEFCTRHVANHIETTCHSDSLLPRTILTMRSTAYDAYWSIREVDTQTKESTREEDYALDDEMLCYATTLRICAISMQPEEESVHSSLETSWSGLLLEFQKRRRRTTSSVSSQSTYPYPLWHQTLQVASKVSRHDYHTLLLRNKSSDTTFPILAKCILTSVLFSWQYRTVQHYNVSFAKEEVVSDMDQLLGIDKENWCVEYAQEFGGLPVSEIETTRGNESTIITVTMKQVSMHPLDTQRLQEQSSIVCIQRDQQRWAFGEQYDAPETCGLAAPMIDSLLRTGSACTKSVTTKTKTAVEQRPTGNSMSSLGKALLDIAPNRPTNHKAALTKNIQKKPMIAKCKFFAQGNCSFGDNCRFTHSS